VSLPIHTVLGVALDAARAVLRELDGDQVPNDLRKVTGHAGSLPAPLARSLLKGLEKYGWLRDKAIEQLPAEASGDRPEAAALYLRRPAGWELCLAEIAAAAGASAAGDSGRSAAGKERDLAALLKATRAKAKSVQKESRATIAELKGRLADRASQQRSEAAGDAKDERQAERVLQAAEEEVTRLREERDAAVRDARIAKQALHWERTLRRRAEADASAGARTSAWADDPAALAERLDRTALMARPAAGIGPAAGAAAPVEEVRLPPGVAPDAKTAIEWLLGVEAAITVIVDGYNVGYLMPGERAPAPARIRVAPVLGHLQKMARGPLKVIVVYDSDSGPVETPLAPGPVSVRYGAGGEAADEEIVRLAGALEGPVVVVSSDREVRDRSEALGALPLWSEALIAWAGSR